MTTRSVDIAEAQTHLKDLVHQVVAGDHIVLSEDEKPVAQLLPVSQRVAGLHTGAMSTTDDFDAELPDGFWAEGK